MALSAAPARDQDALAQGAAPLALGLLAAFSIARSGRPTLAVRNDLTRLVRESTAPLSPTRRSVKAGRKVTPFSLQGVLLTGGSRSVPFAAVVAAVPNLTEVARSTFYGGGRTSLRTEELIELENAGRRCGVCRSGRGWRRFELVRPAQGEPIVLCGGCRARFGDDPPVGREPAPALEPVPAVAEALAPSQPRPGGRGTDRRPDRLRAALGKLPSSFSTAMAARAAGLTATRRLLGSRTWSATARSGASASAGRPSRPRATSPRRWIGLRRERATFGSSGSELGSADRPPAPARVDRCRPVCDGVRSGMLENQMVRRFAGSARYEAGLRNDAYV